MIMLFNVIVVQIVVIVGSNVMVKHPITGSTGTEKPGVKGRKPLAAKLIVSVIVSALAVFVASAPNASAQIAANKGKDFIVAPLSTDRRSDDAQAPLWMGRQPNSICETSPIPPPPSPAASPSP